jgi:hypothetical protein
MGVMMRDKSIDLGSNGRVDLDALVCRVDDSADANGDSPGDQVAA